MASAARPQRAINSSRRPLESVERLAVPLGVDEDVEVAEVLLFGLQGSGYELVDEDSQVVALRRLAADLLVAVYLMLCYQIVKAAANGHDETALLTAAVLAGAASVRKPILLALSCH